MGNGFGRSNGVLTAPVPNGEDAWTKAVLMDKNGARMGWMYWVRGDEHLDFWFIDAVDWPHFAALVPQEEDPPWYVGLSTLAVYLPPFGPARDDGDGTALHPQAAETFITRVSAPEWV